VCQWPLTLLQALLYSLLSSFFSPTPPQAFTPPPPTPTHPTPTPHQPHTNPYPPNNKHDRLSIGAPCWRALPLLAPLHSPTSKPGWGRRKMMSRTCCSAGRVRGEWADCVGERGALGFWVVVQILVVSRLVVGPTCIFRPCRHTSNQPTHQSNHH